MMTDIILITIDSLRYDHVGFSGYERDTTPFIDELATNSCVFENAFSNACATRQSFPAILTSSYTSMYGGYERMSKERTLISEILKQGGYKTAGFHSNLFMSAAFGYDRGFDVFYDSKTNPPLSAKLKQTVKENLNQDGALYNFLSSLVNTAERQAGINTGSAYVSADNITDKSLEWVKTVSDTDSPRFLWTHYMDVHHPYVPPEEYQLEFRDEPIGERRSIQLRRKMLEEPESITDDELDDIINLYDAEIRFTDDEIRRLVEYTKKAWGEDTIVLITSDHGEEFLEHGQFSHHSTFHDEVIHVPLVIDTGNETGKTYDQMVGLIDISPTVVDYAGMDIPENFHGNSIKQLIESNGWQKKEIIGEKCVNGQKLVKIMYRDEKWKYIEEEGDGMLYNLDEDPQEVDEIWETENIPEYILSKIRDHKTLIKEHSGKREQVEMEESVKKRLRDLGYKE